MRLTARWPARRPRAVPPIVPFVPVVALWASSPTRSLPARLLSRAGGGRAPLRHLIYKGILPAYLEDSVVRLAVGALRHGARHPARAPCGPERAAHRLLWPLLLFFQAIGDIAWLPILLIWFGFGLTTMTFVIVYTVLFPVVLNTVLGVRSVPTDMHRAALSLGASRAAHPLGGRAAGRAAEHHDGLRNGLGYGWRALIAAEIIVGTSGIGFLMFDARRAGSVVEIVLGMIVLGLLWYVVDAWILAPIERATGQRWGLVTPMSSLTSAICEDLFRPLRGPACHGRAATSRSRSREGEFVSIVGPSGCGKTTILNMVAGFLPPHRRRDPGRRARRERPRAGPRRGVPVLRALPLEDGARERRLRAEDARRRQGRARGHRARVPRAREASSHAADRYPNELSGGMQQRVGVVRALANEPEVLLMDEPFASVDAQTRMTLQEELTRIWQERRPTVIFITHDVGEAVFLADRVVVLSRAG